MTILQVCAYGAEYSGNFITSLEALEKELDKKGIRTIYAFVGRAAGREWCKEIQKRTKVYFLPEAKARILPKTYQLFRKIYKENDIDIVHSHFELYDIPATVTAPKKTKIFWHLHDPLAHRKGLREIIWKIQYGVVGKKATMLSVSEKHAKFAVGLGFPATQVVYFPNAIHTDRIQETSTHKETNRLLLFGWDVIRKGVDLVAQAADKTDSDGYIVDVVGLDACKSYVENNVTSTKVRYHPPAEDVNTLYAKAKAFLHVSRAEGLSYALLEAIYAGLPVICSDIPENQVAKEFRNVFFVENGNVEEIAREMDRIVAWDGNVAEEDVAFNRAIIHEKYALSAWVSRLIRQYGLCE